MLILQRNIAIARRKTQSTASILAEGIDILEDSIMEASPDLLNALLKDHTTSCEGAQRNIFWATADYEHLGAGYEYHSPITPELITGGRGNVIQPRVLKSREAQRGRSRDRAEVFTPSWVCNAQNNLIDEAWFGRKGVFNTESADSTKNAGGGWETNPDPVTFPEGKTWRDYVRDTRIEITCGEAPYMVSRYDATTGEEIPVGRRIGLLDRKLRVVGENTQTTGDWLKWAQTAFQSIYGYEWQGDNLLLARENLLATFTDYYREKFAAEPPLESKLEIAHIISWNFWQMDGLRGVVPDSCGTRRRKSTNLFGLTEVTEDPCAGCRSGDIRAHNGTYCLVRDWGAQKKTTVRYVDLLNIYRK